jgi:hypothetical protein
MQEKIPSGLATACHVIQNPKVLKIGEIAMRYSIGEVVFDTVFRTGPFFCWWLQEIYT